MTTLPVPPIVLAVESEDGGLLVRFRPSSAGGDAPATAYWVTCGEETIIGNSSPVIVTGLSNGESYSCSVAMENATGWSETSQAVTGVPQKNLAMGLNSPLLKAIMDSHPSPP